MNYKKIKNPPNLMFTLRRKQNPIILDFIFPILIDILNQ